MELGIGEFDAGDRAADRGALQPLLLHRGLELLHGEVGACRVSEAKAAKRSGFEAQSSASSSFCSLTIWLASSRSRP
jgi:hypothetical protein